MYKLNDVSKTKETIMITNKYKLDSEQNKDNNTIKPNFVDTVNGEINIFGSFDNTIMTEIIPTFKSMIDALIMVAPEKRVITINLNSRGGEADIALSLVALMEEAKKKGIIVVTNVMCIAHSAASLVACCGSKGYRFMNTYGNMLVHHYQSGCFVSTDKEIDNNYKYMKRYGKTLQEIYCKNSKMSPKKYEEIVSADSYFLSANEAISLGMIDKVFGG